MTSETVNGGISLDDDAQVRSAETVNGGITAGERVRVAQRRRDGQRRHPLRLQLASRRRHRAPSTAASPSSRPKSVGAVADGQRRHHRRREVAWSRGGILVEKPQRHQLGQAAHAAHRDRPGCRGAGHAALRAQGRAVRAHRPRRSARSAGATAAAYTDTLPAARRLNDPARLPRPGPSACAYNAGLSRRPA